MSFNQQAFERAVRDHGPKLRAYLSRRVGGREELADDLLMQTFLKAWERRETFEDRGEGPSPWLYGIAGFELKMHQRGEARRRAREERYGLENLSQSAPMEETGLKRLSPEQMAAGLRKLKRDDQRLIELCYGRMGTAEVPTLKHKQIADILSLETQRSWKESQVSVQRCRAIYRLRKVLAVKAA